MSYARTSAARLVASHVGRPRAVAAVPRRFVAQLSAFDAALEANSAAQHAHAAGPGQRQPPSIVHSSLAAAAAQAAAPSSAPAPAPSTSTSPAAASSADSSRAAAAAGPVAVPDPAVVDPDADLLAYLARLVMRDGKLARAHSALDQMLAELHLATNAPPLPVLRRALDTVSPHIRIVGRRKGTKVMQTPQPLTDKQRTRQAWKWIVDASDKRVGDKEFDFGRRLALEVLAVLNGQSEANKNLLGRHQQGVTGRAKYVASALSLWVF